MSESPEVREPGRAALRHKSAELIFAAFFFALGAAVAVNSWRRGAGWAEDGPQTGYFPFYIGLLICIASLVNFVQALRSGAAGDKIFVETGQLKLVLAVLAPTAIYVALIKYIGLYEASVLFIAYFMRQLGKYAWWTIGCVALGTSLFFLVIFELWFQLPLPKKAVAEWVVVELRPVWNFLADLVRSFF